MNIMDYRKKPVVIQAIQFNGSNHQEVVDFAKSSHKEYVLVDEDEIVIQTLEGNMIASPGDWIIRGIHGEYYPCKPEIFEASYELAGIPPLMKNTVTPADVESAITDVTYTVLPNGRTTVCQITLYGVFSVEGSSACVDIKNFNQEIGQKIAYENAK